MKINLFNLDNVISGQIVSSHYCFNIQSLGNKSGIRKDFRTVNKGTLGVAKSNSNYFFTIFLNDIFYNTFTFISFASVKIQNALFIFTG